jgi:hypothetical protein
MADTTTPSVAPSTKGEAIMIAAENTKADLVEMGARDAVERTRERALEEARELRDRLTRLIARIEGEPIDAHPPSMGALRHAADLERAMLEWAQARETLRAVRMMRRFVESDLSGATKPAA